MSSYYQDIYKQLSKMYPNRKIYTISDHHFFHSNIILYERPYFTDVTSMNEYMIQEHNKIVGVEDIVLFLGDFSFKKSEISDILSHMNGHKFLILGNHDQPALTRIYGALGFEKVFPNPIKMNHDYFSHYPLDDIDSPDDLHFKLLVKEFKKDKHGKNYHGHIHTVEPSNPPYQNVCCEALNYHPILIGYTEGKLKEEDSPLILNSKHFQDILELFIKEKRWNPSLLITDYIYSMMLESITPYAGSCFIYGSFSLYKKYGYVSNFSDLDVGLIPNTQISITLNQKKVKEITDKIYDDLKEIDDIHLSFIKRIASICAFEANYANHLGYISKCILDINLIPEDFYKEEDFVDREDCSTLEKWLLKDHPSLVEGYRMPSYQVKALNTNGDIANLLLQIIFQKGHNPKKSLAIKKLAYVFKNFGNQDIENVLSLEDTFIRFFLRNILFFNTVNRYSEIEYIQQCPISIDALLSQLPIPLGLQLQEVLQNPHSNFNKVFKEICETPMQDIKEVSKDILRRVK